MFSVFKPLTTIIIVVLFVRTNILRLKQTYFKSILFGLVFCFIGDVFLLNDEQFVFGLGAFLVAHLLFTYGFWRIGNREFYLLPLLILLIIGSSYYVYLYNELAELAIPVAFYVFVIIIMCWQAISLYMNNLKNKFFLMIGIGALLFLVSDSIIALNKFKEPFKASTMLILSTYWLSLGMITNAKIGED